MASIFGTSASFKDLQKILQDHAAYVPQTAEEFLDFKSYYYERQAEIPKIIEQERLKDAEELEERSQEIKNRREQIELRKEKWTNNLVEQRERLRKRVHGTRPSRGVLLDLLDQAGLWFAKQRLNTLEKHMEREVQRPFRSAEKNIVKLQAQYDYLKKDLESTVMDRVKAQLSGVEKTRRLLKEYKPLVIGMIGEIKAIKALRKLPETFTVLNDVRLHFSTPYYYYEENTYISEVNIDHLVIGPPGIFIIETKHWSKASVDNRDLRSPVAQVRRAGNALFRYTHDRLSAILQDHWGSRRIPVRNIILMTNVPVARQYEWVEVHHVSSICRSLGRRTAKLTTDDIQRVVRFYKDYLQ